MSKRKVGKTVVRKGVRITSQGARVVTTRRPKGVAARLLDAALRKAGR